MTLKKIEQAPAIDTLNRHLVAAQGDHVVVMNPARRMTPTEAMTLAAWLVTIAEAIDPDADFAATLQAVQNT